MPLDHQSTTERRKGTDTTPGFHLACWRWFPPIDSDSSSEDAKVAWNGGQALTPCCCDHDDILDANAHPVFEIDPGLNREHHPRLQLGVDSGSDYWGLVNVETDAVACPMNQAATKL